MYFKVINVPSTANLQKTKTTSVSINIMNLAPNISEIRGAKNVPDIDYLAIIIMVIR